MATQKADGSIYIKTEIDTTEAKASVKEIASLLKRLSNQVKTIGKSMEKAMSGGIKAPDAKGMDVVEEKAKTVAKELEKTAQAEKKLDNIDIKTTALDTLDKAIETTGQKSWKKHRWMYSTEIRVQLLPLRFKQWKVQRLN